MNEAREMLEQTGLKGSSQLVENWAGLLENVGNTRTPHGRRVQAVVAQLYENEYRALCRGGMGGGTMQLREDTTTANAGLISTVMFPLIKAIWRNMIGLEVATVQPVDQPFGTIFSRQRLYQNAKGATAAGTAMVVNLDHQYASEYVTDELLGTGDGASFGGGGAVLAQTLLYHPVRPLNATSGYSCIIEEVNAATGATIQSAVDDAAGGFTFTPAGGFTSGAIDYTTGAVTNFNFQAAPGGGNPINATYQWIMEGSNLVPEFMENITPQGVQTQPRKLKYRYSTEARDDIAAVHGMDVEQMLTSDAAREITLEIDRDIISRMFVASTGAARTFSFVVPPGISEIDHIRGVLTRMSEVGAVIQQNSGFAPANFFVTDPLVASRINQTRSDAEMRALWTPQGAPGDPFTGDIAVPGYTNQMAQAGIMRMGLTNMQWVGYCDTGFTTMTGGNYILMGLKGMDWWDGGVAYVPYIPIEIMPALYSPENDTTVRLVRTRDQIVTLRTSYYGRVRITAGL